MSSEPAPESVLDEPGRAVRAFEFEATFPAERHRRIAAAIEEQERLLAAPQGLGDSVNQDRGEPASALRRCGPHVYCQDGREACRLVASPQSDMAVAALLGVDQAIDGGGGRAQP